VECCGNNRRGGGIGAERRVVMAKTAEILAGFPKTWVLDYGAKATVRPMVKEDRDKVVEFFKKIPEGDLRFLKDDVTDAQVIDQWVHDLNYDRVLPLVVEMDGRIIADGSLHRRKEGWRRHLASVRVVVDVAHRHKGVASRLIDELADIAMKEGIERLYTELPADDRAAVEVFLKRGFKLIARFDRNILDRAGRYHDLSVYHLDLATRR
jgi:L-amino acid N-acyltransferase YncA